MSRLRSEQMGSARATPMPSAIPTSQVFDIAATLLVALSDDSVMAADLVLSDVEVSCENHCDGGNPSSVSVFTSSTWNEPCARLCLLDAVAHDGHREASRQERINSGFGSRRWCRLCVPATTCTSTYTWNAIQIPGSWPHADLCFRCNKRHRSTC